MISRKIPEFFKISHHKFTSRKFFPIFSQKVLKQGIKFSRIFPDFLILGNISHFVQEFPFWEKLGNLQKRNLSEQHQNCIPWKIMGKIWEYLGNFSQIFPNGNFFFPKKLLFLTVQISCLYHKQGKIYPEWDIIPVTSQYDSKQELFEANIVIYWR